jgi:hypothetical protein
MTIARTILRRKKSEYTCGAAMRTSIVASLALRETIFSAQTATTLRPSNPHAMYGLQQRPRRTMSATTTEMYCATLSVFVKFRGSGFRNVSMISSCVNNQTTPHL